MGLKRYLRLFKTKDVMSSVRNHYFLNIFIMFAYVVLIAASLLTDATTVLSQALSIGGAFAIVASIISERIFMRNVKFFINSDTLDQTYALDRSIAKYRSEFLGYIKGIQRSLRVPTIIGGALIAAGIVCIMIATFLYSANPNDRIAGRLSAIYIAAMVIAIIIILLPSFFNGMRGTWFEQNMGKEIRLIDENRFKIMKIRSKVKYSILEDKTPEKQISYSFANETLRAKATMLHGYSKKATSVGLIALVFIVVGTMLAASLMPQNVSGIFTPVVIGLSLLAYLIVIIVISRKKSILEKQQIEEYELGVEDVENQKLLLTMKKAHHRRWNIYFLMVLISFFVAPSILAAIVVGVFKASEEIGTTAYLIGIGAMLVLFILILVFWGNAYKRMRLKMWPIEDEIERKSNERN